MVKKDRSESSKQVENEEKSLDVDCESFALRKKLNGMIYRICIIPLLPSKKQAGRNRTGSSSVCQKGYVRNCQQAQV